MKRLGVLIIFLLTTVRLLAQTQYDYYEGRDAYGGVDTAITGIKIIGIIVLVVVVILAIAAIYGYFAGWFKNEQKTHDDSTLIIQSPKLKHNNDKEPPTNEIEESCVPEKVHSEIITIDGSIIEGNLTQKDGSKRNEWYWYNILSIKHNLNDEIIHEIGTPISRKGSSWYLADYLDENDLLLDTVRPAKMHMELEITTSFSPDKLQLMVIDGFNNLYDWQIWFYEGVARRQEVVDEKRVKEVLSAYNK